MLSEVGILFFPQLFSQMLTNLFCFDGFSLRHLGLTNQTEPMAKLHKSHLAVVSRTREGSVGRTDVDLRQTLITPWRAPLLDLSNYQH